MRTDELIIELARGAGPVRPLAPPSARLGQWTLAAVAIAALGTMIIGPRADVMTAVHQQTFMNLAALTLLTALLSAAGAFVLSVPGAERSPLVRALPVMAGITWTLALVALIAAGGDPVRRVVALPIHVACILEIAGVGMLAGWPLFAMLRRAAPLRLRWTAALATLAAVSFGAAATQFICPIDDPAHQLVGHAVPVMLLAGLGALAGRRWLDGRATASGRTSAPGRS